MSTKANNQRDGSPSIVVLLVNLGLCTHKLPLTVTDALKCVGISNTTLPEKGHIAKFTIDLRHLLVD